MASGVSSAMVVPGQKVICWTAFSPITGNFYLMDPGTFLVTEVMVNSQTYKPTMVKVRGADRPVLSEADSPMKQYDAGAGHNLLDGEVTTVNGRDYLYVLAPNATSIDVFSLRSVGNAQLIQSFDFTSALDGIDFGTEICIRHYTFAHGNVDPTDLEGMTAFFA